MDGYLRPPAGGDQSLRDRGDAVESGNEPDRRARSAPRHGVAHLLAGLHHAGDRDRLRADLRRVAVLASGTVEMEPQPGLSVAESELYRQPGHRGHVLER